MRIVKLSWMLVIVFAVVAALWIAPAVAQKHKAAAEGNWIEGVSEGGNLVGDMTYPVSEKFPAWPGDDHVFEAKANATVEKDGYFTRSFWMLEHYGTHMDANKVMHFPGYSVESAKLLIERGVVGLGIDTLSIDYGASKNYEVHRVDLPAGLYNLENLAHTEELPETGAYIIAAPIKLEGGSGGPCRVFAVLPPK